jgi:hypothetical protein
MAPRSSPGPAAIGAPLAGLLALAAAVGACGRAGFERRGPDPDAAGEPSSAALVSVEGTPPTLQVRRAEGLGWSAPLALDPVEGGASRLVAARMSGGELLVAYRLVTSTLVARRVEAGPAPRIDPPLVLSTASAPAAHVRSFDIAVEATTGHAVIVYSDGGEAPLWRRYAEGVWSPGERLAGAGVGAVAWIATAARPGTAEIALAYMTEAKKLYLRVWDGVAWDAPPAGPLAVVRTTDFECFALAYERDSGKLFVVWAEVDLLRWSRRELDGTLSAPGTYRLNATTGALAAVAEPGSNRIAVVSTEAGYGDSNDLSALIWDGGAWVAGRPADGAADWMDPAIAPFDDQLGAAPAQVAWPAPGRASFLYADRDTTAAFEWTVAAGFSVPAPAPSPEAVRYARVLIPGPGAAHDLVVAVTRTGDLVPLARGAGAWPSTAEAPLGRASAPGAYAIAP